MYFLMENRVEGPIKEAFCFYINGGMVEPTFPVEKPGGIVVRYKVGWNWKDSKEL